MSLVSVLPFSMVFYLWIFIVISVNLFLESESYINAINHKRTNLLATHKALLEYVYQFKLLYYKRQMSRLHFVRPYIHVLVHLVPEHF